MDEDSIRLAASTQLKNSANSSIAVQDALFNRIALLERRNYQVGESLKDPIKSLEEAWQAKDLIVVSKLVDNARKLLYGVQKLTTTITNFTRTGPFVDLGAGARAVKQVFDLSLVGPDTGFKAEDIAEACARVWGLQVKRVDSEENS
jgi:hypothetical protein